MSITRNKVELWGHVGKSYGLETSGDKKYMRFTVATNYKDKTDWHNVVCFGKTAEIQCNLKKGDYVCLDGSISYRPYTDKDGNKKISTSILANTIICMRTKGENQAIEPEDDLPF